MFAGILIVEKQKGKTLLSGSILLHHFRGSFHIHWTGNGALIVSEFFDRDLHFSGMQFFSRSADIVPVYSRILPSPSELWSRIWIPVIWPMYCIFSLPSFFQWPATLRTTKRSRCRRTRSTPSLTFTSHRWGEVRRTPTERAAMIRARRLNRWWAATRRRCVPSLCIWYAPSSSRTMLETCPGGLYQHALVGDH